jgi:hypothetical protein
VEGEKDAVDVGDAISPHSVDRGNGSLEVDAHKLGWTAPPGRLASSATGVPTEGVCVDDEGVLVIIPSGGSILKIWSSAWGGPYESNGSGIACSIGSITGSELK